MVSVSIRSRVICLCLFFYDRYLDFSLRKKQKWKMDASDYFSTWSCQVWHVKSGEIQLNWPVSCVWLRKFMTEWIDSNGLHIPEQQRFRARQFSFIIAASLWSNTRSCFAQKESWSYLHRLCKVIWQIWPWCDST